MAQARLSVRKIREVLRLKAEVLQLDRRPGALAAAEEHFRQALDWARKQGILSMELRCAVSLARLWQQHGRSDEARKLLTPVYARFTEGFGTAELQAAKGLLDALG